MDLPKTAVLTTRIHTDSDGTGAYDQAHDGRKVTPESLPVNGRPKPGERRGHAERLAFSSGPARRTAAVVSMGNLISWTSAGRGLTGLRLSSSGRASSRKASAGGSSTWTRPLSLLPPADPLTIDVGCVKDGSGDTSRALATG